MTGDELDRLLRLLREHPERQTELREMLDDPNWGRVTRSLDALAAAQLRTEERLAALTGRVDALTARVDALAERVDALAAAQVRTEERLAALTGRVDALTERVDALAAAQQRTEERLEALGRYVDRLAKIVEGLTEQVSALTGHVDWLRGDAIERRYRERPHTYLSTIARRLHTLTPRELDDLLEAAVADGILTEDETDELRRADAVLQGRRREDGAEVYVVVEASVGVGLKDVDRARRRADLLARTGRDAVAVVGGTWVVPEAQAAARAYRVWQVTDGRAVAPAS
ncbi:MAG: hypothetical protein M3N57_04520 [Actinomycetota bacterium]|nr:hypothetical protein [Actinomycetota bacterium]